MNVVADWRSSNVQRDRVDCDVWKARIASWLTEGGAMAKSQRLSGDHPLECSTRMHNDAGQCSVVYGEG